MPDIYFEHFQGEPSDAPSFYEAWGRSLVVWGRLETMIDDAMLTILARRQPATLGKRVEWSFSKKMKLWRQLFQDEPQVAGLRDDAMEVADRAEVLYRRRSRLLHASLGDLDADGAAIAFQFEHGKDGKPYFRKFKFDAGNMRMLLADTLSLAELVGATALGVYLCWMAPGQVVRSNAPGS